MLDPIEKIIERIKESLGAPNDAEVARLLGVPQQSVYGARKKGKIPPSWTVELAEKYTLSPSWVLYGVGPEFLKPLKEYPEKKQDEFVYIPLAEAQLSAGNGAWVISENHLEKYAFRNEWIHKVTCGKEKLVLMFVTGNSMSPTIENGDIVMIDRGRITLKNGLVYALRLGDLISVKRLEAKIGGKVEVISDNRAEYPPYDAPLEDVVILGQVIWLGREIFKP